jgi:hypothetical protein
MRKIVISTSYGDRNSGFCLSHQAWVRLRDMGQREALQEGDVAEYWPTGASLNEPALNQCGRLIPRDDQHLVRVVEELGTEANGHCAALKVVEIPTDVEWTIEEKSGGVEWVSEVHRTWS